jgi:arylsulfatase
VSLYLDGNKISEGRVDATVPVILSADETADVGRDTASPVSDDYDGESSVFTGTVN